MRSKLLRVSLISTVTIAAFLVVPLVVPGEVFPVRFGDESPLGSVVLPGETVILDPHVQRVTSPDSGSQEEIVPVQAITSRCGDRDGCRLRLFAALAGSARDIVQKAALFSVDAPGVKWKTVTYDGTVIAAGRTDGNGSETVLFLDTIGGVCKLRDDGVTLDYRLEVSQDGLSQDCLLRIDD